MEARSGGGVSTFSPASAPARLHSYLLNTDVLPQLVINEFMAANASCCPDNSSGIAEYDDWIEIYNRGNTPVDIAGFYLSDDTSNPFNSRIASGTTAAATTIPAGGYLRIWADGNRDQGPLHLDFALNALGEAVGLYYKDGRKIDEVTFTTQPDNVSTGRLPDGEGSFQQLSTPSPGQANN